MPKLFIFCRWNSELHMVRSILAISPENLLGLQTGKTLSTDDRELLAHIEQILVPFEQVTNKVQGEKIVTSSMVIPCIRVLQAKMLKLSCQQQSLVDALIASMERRFDVYQCNITFIMATILDPRFKLQWANHAEIIAYKTTFAQQLEKFQVTPSQSASHPEDDFFSDIFKGQSHGTLEQEIDDYLLEQCQLQHIDPLEYWSNKCVHLPSLAKAAQYYLSIPASSAPVERLFSVAGKLFQPLSSNLKDDTFLKLMFIKGNST